MPNPRPPPSVSSNDEAFEEAVETHPSALAELLRGETLYRGAELKFYETTASLGVGSSITWTELDYLPSIVAGTGQNQRLGRKIRLIRMRYVLRLLTNAETTFAAVTGVWKDQTVSGSDLFSTSGSARTELCAPNPTCVVKLQDVRGPKTALQFAGGAYGTTPSYVTNVHVFDVHFGKNGMPIIYDGSGSTLGPYPSVWYCFNETSVTPEAAVEFWYTDE